MGAFLVVNWETWDTYVRNNTVNSSTAYNLKIISLIGFIISFFIFVLMFYWAYRTGLHRISVPLSGNNSAVGYVPAQPGFI
jgi:hypothetical protein